jgi:hypothetical protein
MIYMMHLLSENVYEKIYILRTAEIYIIKKQ